MDALTQSLARGMSVASSGALDPAIRSGLRPNNDKDRGIHKRHTNLHFQAGNDDPAYVRAKANN